MGGACLNPECTVTQTGICLLNNDALTCPKRETPDLVDAVTEIDPVLEEPVLEEPITKARFPGSLSLSPNDTQQLMNKQYTHLVGILGAPNAGKTAFLVSLYLLLSHNKLKGFEFRNSSSIMAFEEIARGARRWNEGHPPEQMTSHTELTDDRSAGFMHLRLHDVSTSEPIDILMPDLPGEWSNALIDNNRLDRFGFLKSVDIIWLMVNGKMLIQQKTCQLALHRTKQLMKRIAAFLEPNIPPIILVITWRDFGTLDAAIIEILIQEAERLSMTMNVIHIASFTNDNDVEAGTGVADLISSTVRDRSSGLRPFWPDFQVKDNDRFALKFRNRGNCS